MTGGRPLLTDAQRQELARAISRLPDMQRMLEQARPHVEQWARLSGALDQAKMRELVNHYSRLMPPETYARLGEAFARAAAQPPPGSRDDAEGGGPAAAAIEVDQEDAEALVVASQQLADDAEAQPVLDEVASEITRTSPDRPINPLFLAVVVVILYMLGGAVVDVTNPSWEDSVGKWEQHGEFAVMLGYLVFAAASGVTRNQPPSPPT